MVLGRIMSCGVRGVTPEWVQRQHRDHGFGEGRGKCSGRWDKVSQSEWSEVIIFFTSGTCIISKGIRKEEVAINACSTTDLSCETHPDVMQQILTGEIRPVESSEAGAEA